ncbi:MAG: flagellar basal body L-ring protein FlgH [Planctomycetaceae bacterium]|nr:flagellar basal body L-ring protein FlgH [Planctomycetaceae bacterium]MCB9952697.1 flagellar basal body L-ring protein FlgH [Planctomycetaceae bacterium]
MLLSIPSLQAESIWQRHTQEHGFLFYDAKARDVGDLLTVVISQDTTLGHREDRGMSKSSGIGGVFALAGKAGGGFGTQGADTSLDLSNESDRNFKGAESFSSEQALTDRVTVSVVAVMPNGNLVLSGTRTIQVAGEVRTMNVSGSVRAIDVGPDNTVVSRSVADLQITYDAVGPGKKFTRQGWFERCMNRVWPF